MTDEQLRDEHLLQRLGAALVPAAAPTVPPPTAMQDLHRVIDASRAAGAVPAGRRPRLLTVAVGATLAAACVGIAVVATSMPRWSRETATRVTVVTTSPAFGAVVERQRLLDAALDDGDIDQVLIESARLRFALANLSAGEVAPIRDEIEALLERADTFLQRRGADDDETPAISPADTSTTQPGEVTATTQPATSAPGRTTPRVQPSATASSVTTPDDDVDDIAQEIDDDNSGPGGGGPDDPDDNSGPGGGGGDPGPDGVPDDDSGSGSG